MSKIVQGNGSKASNILILGSVLTIRQVGPWEVNCVIALNIMWWEVDQSTTVRLCCQYYRPSLLCRVSVVEACVPS
jgi:hypothetical protein